MDKNELYNELCRKIEMANPVECAGLSPIEESFLSGYRTLDQDGRNAILSKMNKARNKS